MHGLWQGSPITTEQPAYDDLHASCPSTVLSALWLCGSQQSRNSASCLKHAYFSKIPKAGARSRLISSSVCTGRCGTIINWRACFKFAILSSLSVGIAWLLFIGLGRAYVCCVVCSLWQPFNDYCRANSTCMPSRPITRQVSRIAVLTRN